jgi:hypothetical protein
MLEPRTIQEAADFELALNEAERNILALLREGWLIVSDQYSGRREWLEKDGEVKKMPRKVREYSEWYINIFNLTQITGERKTKTTDGRGFERIYVQTTYRIHRAAKQC